MNLQDIGSERWLGLHKETAGRCPICFGDGGDYEEGWTGRLGPVNCFGCDGGMTFDAFYIAECVRAFDDVEDERRA